MNHIFRILEKFPVPVMLLCIFLVAAVGYFDYTTGAEIDISIFYIIPIALACWVVSRRMGVVMSILSAITWFLADNATYIGHSHPGIPYWNAAVVLGFALLITFSLSALKSAMAMQDQLSQFIVHDLRSPLTNILTGLQTLDIIAHDELTTEAKEIVEMGVISSNRMLNLINTLLDVPKMESGRMPVHQDEVQAAELVEQAFQQVGSWALQNNITLKADITPEDMKLIADRDLTVRVITNLLSNALKFSPVDAEILVSVCHGENGLIKFSVKDQGPGIPEAWAKKVFDKYAQIEARKDGARIGTGLGLTFCQLAVESHGGKIWLESQVGKGTTFIFTLPANGI